MSIIERALSIVRERIKNNETSAERHPDLLERELARARAGALRAVLSDLEGAFQEPATKAPAPAIAAAASRAEDGHTYTYGAAVDEHGRLAMIYVPLPLAQMMLDSVWEGQTATAHAAENTVCAYGCGEPFRDFVAHESHCKFLFDWATLVNVRAALGDERAPAVRGEALL